MLEEVHIIKSRTFAQPIKKKLHIRLSRGLQRANDKESHF